MYSYADVYRDGNSLTVIPNGGLNGFTVLYSDKDLDGLLDYVDSTVLEEGRTINRDMFYKLLSTMLVDKDLASSDNDYIEKNMIMALAMANNFHDTPVDIKECHLDANNAADYVYKVNVYGKDDTWIVNYANRTVFWNDGATEYSSDMFKDEYLAYWCDEDGGFHKQLKTKFIDGNAGFMSLVALALVLGLAFCIERIIYLTLSEIKTYKLMEDIEKHLQQNDVEGAKTLCRNTRGPVASVCYQGLLHIHQSMDAIERSITNYGGLQAANLEKGCSWIKLFIAMAPSLGFLGTVIGMVMAFDQIQLAGDIGPTIVARGMKVALITTIFGIVVALILQLFYSYILSKIERLTAQMEESAITLLDLITEYKTSRREE